MPKTSKEVEDLGCEPLKNPAALEVLREDIIRTWMLSHLRAGTRGPDRGPARRDGMDAV